MSGAHQTATGRKRSRGRTIALASACLAALLLALATWVSRGWLLETWYIHQLGSEHEGTRLAAAEKLGQMGSLRAVPTFVQLICRDRREDPTDTGGRIALTPILFALYQVGPSAEDLLLEENRRLAEIPITINTRAISTATTTLNQGPEAWTWRARRGIGSVLLAWERDLEARRVAYDLYVPVYPTLDLSDEPFRSFNLPK